MLEYTLEYAEVDRYVNRNVPLVPALAGAVTGGLMSMSRKSWGARSIMIGGGAAVSVAYSYAGEIAGVLSGRGGRF